MLLSVDIYSFMVGLILSIFGCLKEVAFYNSRKVAACLKQQVLRTGVQERPTEYNTCLLQDCTPLNQTLLCDPLLRYTHWGMVEKWSFWLYTLSLSK